MGSISRQNVTGRCHHIIAAATGTLGRGTGVSTGADTGSRYPNTLPTLEYVVSLRSCLFLLLFLLSLLFELPGINLGRTTWHVLFDVGT